MFEATTGLGAGRGAVVVATRSRRGSGRRRSGGGCGRAPQRGSAGHRRRWCGHGRATGHAGRTTRRQRRQLDGRRSGRLGRKIDADSLFFGLHPAGGFFFHRLSARWGSRIDREEYRP